MTKTEKIQLLNWALKLWSGELRASPKKRRPIEKILNDITKALRQQAKNLEGQK